MGRQSPQFDRFSIYYYYYYSFLSFSSPALAEIFSQEFERQQVSSSLLDSSQYPSRSLQCCCMDGVHSPCYFQVFLWWLIGITVTFMLHSFFNSLARSKYLSFFSLSLNFSLWSAGTAKSRIQQVLSLFFFFVVVDYYRFWSTGRNPFASQNPRGVWVSKSLKQILCIYHLFAWSNFNFLHNSLCIPLPTQSCLVLYSFCANLLHSLMRLIVLSLSPH